MRKAPGFTARGVNAGRLFGLAIGHFLARS